MLLFCLLFPFFFFSFLFLFFFYKASRFILLVQIFNHSLSLYILVWLKRINPFAYDWYIYQLTFKYPTRSNYLFHIYIYIYKYVIFKYIRNVYNIYICILKLTKRRRNLWLKKRSFMKSNRPKKYKVEYIVDGWSGYHKLIPASRLFIIQRVTILFVLLSRLRYLEQSNRFNICSFKYIICIFGSYDTLIWTWIEFYNTLTLIFLDKLINMYNY